MTSIISISCLFIAIWSSKCHAGSWIDVAPTPRYPLPTVSIFPRPCREPCPDGQVCRFGECVCRPPRVQSNCAQLCKTTCDNIDNPPICNARCLPAITCICPPGYVEKSSTDSTCVKREECPKKCPKPKVLESCASACPDTCDNFDEKGPRICPAICRLEQCVCPKGYVEKSDTDTTCVKPVDCPKRCPKPKVFEECPTACPITCDNIDNPPTFCTFNCRPENCVCPKGYVEKSSTDSTCVRPSECKKKVPLCQLPKVIGPCKAAIPQYYFNAVTGECELFYYGGCEGNANRFDSRKECEKACSVCKINKDSGPCDAYFEKYYYNQQTKECETFIWGGCRGNANRFDTLASCRRTCGKKCPRPKVFVSCPSACPDTCDNLDDEGPRICPAVCRPEQCVCPEGYVEKSATDTTCVKPADCPRNVCRPKCPRGKRCQNGECVDVPCGLDKAPGPCEAFIPSYFYNRKTKKCEKFIYGGCQGNENRFETIEKCRQTCNECPKPKVFQECPTSCPITCDNINNPPEACITLCRPEQCVCPKGYVEKSNTDSTCVRPSQCKKVPVCKQPKVTGPCFARFIRYYYNQKTGDCEKFTYGGCQGNDNKFDTLKECRDKCVDKCIFTLCPEGTVCQNGECLKVPCELDKDPGPCKQTLPKYFYNRKTKRCEKFIYGGCKGNKNRFDSLAQCRRRCEDPCWGKRCPYDSVCRKGVCLKRCGIGYCAPNNQCSYGKCVCLGLGTSTDCTVY